MKKIGLSAAIATALVASASAFAADLPPIAPAPVAAWTGCYVGVNGGGVWSHSSFNWAPGSTFPAIAASGELASLGGNNLDASGGTAGGQFGCNTQSGAFVVGFETDIQWTDINKTVTGFFPATGNALAASFSEHVKSDWLLTNRLRVGYLVTPDFLLYATGGMATARVTFEDSVAFLGAGGAGASVNAVSETRNKFGWTVGVGGEWMFAPNWTLKAEYLHVDLGSFANTSVNVSAAGVVNPNAFILHNHDLTEDIARIGINYKFGSLFGLF